MYGSETWSPTNKQDDAFASFERRILRSISGPVHEHDTWRIRNNRELTELFSTETIVSAINYERLRWAMCRERIEL